MKSLRLAAGLSQEALAKEIGVSLQTVGTWERGVNIPSLEKTAKLAEALEVSFKVAAASVGVDVSKVPDDYQQEVGYLSPDKMPSKNLLSEDSSDFTSDDPGILRAQRMAAAARNLQVPLKALFRAFGIDTTGIPDDFSQAEPGSRPASQDDL